MKHFLVFLFVSMFLFSISCDNSKSRETIDRNPNDTIEEILPPPDSTSIPEEARITDPKDLIDYFILLQQNGKVGNDYRFAQSNGKWECYSKDTPDRTFSSVVDFQNGYLSISDDGTGGGNYNTEMALFKRIDGGYFIAVNNYSESPAFVHVDISNISLRFYYYEHQKLIEITKEVFPKQITGKDFSTADNAETLQTYYKLPIRGTVITAEYNKSFCGSCNSLEVQKENMDHDGYQQRKELCKTCTKITKEKILIPFNKEKELFLPE